MARWTSRAILARYPLFSLAALVAVVVVQIVFSTAIQYLFKRLGWPNVQDLACGPFSLSLKAADGIPIAQNNNCDNTK